MEEGNEGKRELEIKKKNLYSYLAILLLHSNKGNLGSHLLVEICLF